MRRLLTGLVTVLALGSMLSGCSLAPQVACPAIGWINTVTVTLNGAVQSTNSVELCIDEDCSTGAKRDDQTWTFTLDMGAPKAVTVRALSADGTTLAERDVKLSWKRVGGSEQCGGPVQTPPIVLSIPG